MAVSLGMDRAIHVFVSPLAGKDEEKAVYLVRRFLTLRFVLGLAAAAILFLFAAPIMSALGQPRVGGLLKWMGPYVISIGLTNLFFANFSARLDMKNPRLVKAAIQMVNAIGAVWIYRYGGGAGIVLTLLSLTVTLTALAMAWMSRALITGPAGHGDLEGIRSYCASQTVMEVLAFILGKNADIILLNLLLAGTLQVGYYSVAAALTLAISTMLIAGAGDIALSATSIMVQRGDPDQLRLAWRFRIKTSMLLTVPFMVYGFAVAPEIVGTLLDRTYLPAADVFRVAIGGQIFISLLGGGAHGDILLSSERHRTVRNLSVGSGAVNVVLNLILIPLLGAAGAATAAAVALLVLAEYSALRRIHPVSLPGRSMGSILAASVLAAAAVVWFPLHRWAFLAASGAGFVLVFGLLAWWLKPYDAEDVPVFERIGAPFDRLERWLTARG